ncbi:MAG: hypothetical protein Q7R52_05325 [archaeon]|nr:hypothetical protein [archaeon]
MSIENTVRNIVESDWELYGLHNANENFDYAINRQWHTNMIRDGGMALLDLPEDRIHILNILTRNKKSGHQRQIERSFMEHKNHLIPLQTHTSPNKRDYSVDRIDNNGKVLNKKPIEDYFMDICGEEIILTRVLSEDEVKQWNNPDSELGSTHQLFWTIPTIHTAYHSITDEFTQNPNYARVIKYILTREEMNKALKSGVASIGTYDIQFRFREADSTLPFDMEVVFDDQKEFDILKKGYARWKERTGNESIENPFLHYDRFKSTKS